MDITRFNSLGQWTLFKSEDTENTLEKADRKIIRRDTDPRGKPKKSEPSAMQLRAQKAENKYVQSYTGENTDAPKRNHEFTLTKLVAQPKSTNKQGETKFAPALSEHVVHFEGKPVGFAQVHHYIGDKPHIKLELPGIADRSPEEQNQIVNRLKMELAEHVKSPEFAEYMKHYNANLNEKATAAAQEKGEAIHGIARDEEAAKEWRGDKAEQRQQNQGNFAPGGELRTAKPAWEATQAVSAVPQRITPRGYMSDSSDKPNRVKSKEKENATSNGPVKRITSLIGTQVAPNDQATVSPPKKPIGGR